MLSLVRPKPDARFADEAKALLDALRAEVAAQGNAQSLSFEKREIWSGVWRKDGRHKKALIGIYPDFAKCAFCERLRDWNRELDVEHYRPKAEVTRWDGSPHEVSDEPPKEVFVSHGYWWLAFSWSNYSLACKACNQTWKRNLFPVRAPRPIYHEGVESEEEPLLLDPMTHFRTRDHFCWDEFGYIRGVSDIGKATIITCGLNRKILVELRRRVIKNLGERLDELHRAVQHGAEDSIRRELRTIGALGARTSEFAGMVRWWAEENLESPWEEWEGLPL